MSFHILFGSLMVACGAWIMAREWVLGARSAEALIPDSMPLRDFTIGAALLAVGILIVGAR